MMICAFYDQQSERMFGVIGFYDCCSVAWDMVLLFNQHVIPGCIIKSLHFSNLFTLSRSH